MMLLFTHCGIASLGLRLKLVPTILHHNQNRYISSSVVSIVSKSDVRKHLHPLLKYYKTFVKGSKRNMLTKERTN